MSIWLALFWIGPIGIGIFLVGLGAMVYVFSKADEVSKRTKAFAREKELDNK
jgi:formate-dependent nitrite reductase membrane component NrfD